MASAGECGEAHDSIGLMAILGLWPHATFAARRRLGWVSEAAKMRRGEQRFEPVGRNEGCDDPPRYSLTLRSRSALPTTLTDENAMAAAAMTGESRMPNAG
jgi:hypothetical protein